MYHCISTNMFDILTYSCSKNLVLFLHCLIFNAFSFFISDGLKWEQTEKCSSPSHQNGSLQVKKMRREIAGSGLLDCDHTLPLCFFFICS